MAVAARAEPYRSGVIIARKYRLAERIGVGAMGTVWSAVNMDTHGRVAVKLIERPEAELRHRLLREARACAAIQHKNVVQVFDVGQTASEDPFLLMELLRGETLAAFLARKRSLAAGEAGAIARDIARGLGAAHAQGIVHRDLKPANVFLHDQPGEDAPVIKLLDFGVSKCLTSSDGLRTVAGAPIGSPVYMSPEQACGRPDVDFRTDIWSLGVVLYEMLTGERPFSGDPGEVCYRIMHGSIPRVSHRVRRVDRDLDELVAACLTRDRDQRLSSAAEIAARLDALLAAGLPEARGSVLPAADPGPAAPGGAPAPAAAVRAEDASPMLAGMVSGTRPRGSAVAWADDPDGEDGATVRIETGPALLELVAGAPATPAQESGPLGGTLALPVQESGPLGGAAATAVRSGGDVPAAPSPADRSAHAAVTAPSALERAGRSRRAVYLLVALTLVWAAVVCAAVLLIRMRLSRGIDKEPAPPPPPASAPVREGAPERAQPGAGEGRPGGETPSTTPAAGKPQVGSPAVGKPQVGSPAVGKPQGASPAVARPQGGSTAAGKSRVGSPAVGKPQGASPAVGKPQGGGVPPGQPQARTTPGQGSRPACKSKFGIGCKH